MKDLLRIGLLDSDSDVRFGRKSLLSSIRNFDIVFESEGSYSDLQAIENSLIDVLVVDQRLKSGPGVEFYKRLREVVGPKEIPNAVLTSSFTHAGLTVSAIEAGFCAVSSLEDGPEQLLGAVEQSKAGLSSHTLGELHRLFVPQELSGYVDLELVRLVGELPQRLAPSLKKLIAAWLSDETAKRENFDLKSLDALVARLPVKTVSEFVLKAYRSGLLNG